MYGAKQLPCALILGGRSAEVRDIVVPIPQPFAKSLKDGATTCCGCVMGEFARSVRRSPKIIIYA
jgi:hypothetical protein